MNRNRFIWSRITAFVLTVFLCTNGLSAQETQPPRFTIGAEAGTTFCRIYTTVAAGQVLANAPDDTQEAAPGFYTGLVAAYRLNDKLDLISGIGYSSSRYRYTQPDGFFMQADSSFTAMYTEAREAMNGLLLPVDVRYRFRAEPASWFVQVGGAAGFYTGSKKQFSYYADTDETLLGSQEIKGRFTAFNSWPFYLRFGTGYSRPLGKSMQATLLLNGHFALRNVLSDEVAFNANHKIHFLQVGLQLTYNR